MQCCLGIHGILLCFLGTLRILCIDAWVGSTTVLLRSLLIDESLGRGLAALLRHTSTIMHMLKHIGDEVKNSNTSQLQKQTVSEIELLISLIEDPVFHDIIVIFDSLNDLNNQILQHPSILPGDFIINSAGQLEVSIPNSTKSTVND
ncbi:Similar to Patj: Patj homolog (Drosophila melanogaster), partial [Cotesia congregata]